MEKKLAGKNLEKIDEKRRKESNAVANGKKEKRDHSKVLRGCGGSTVWGRWR